MSEPRSARGAMSPVALVLALAGLGATAVPSRAEPAAGWPLVYDGGSQQGDTGMAALADPTGDLVLAGEVTDHAGSGSLLVRKVDRDTGDPIWTFSFPGTADNRIAMGAMAWDGMGAVLIGATRLGCFG